MKWISLEGKILLMVNFIDCGVSSYSFHWGVAVERNPIMQFFLERSLLSFIAFKIITVVALVFFLEFLRYKQPEDVGVIKMLQWTAILIPIGLILLMNLVFSTS